MIFGALFMAVAVAAQSSSTTSRSVATSTKVFDEGVPTDKPLSGDYTGVWRPQTHFSPPSGFMNDPNGCFLDANGTYHLYYQCMPCFSSS